MTLIDGRLPEIMDGLGMKFFRISLNQNVQLLKDLKTHRITTDTESGALSTTDIELHILNYLLKPVIIWD